MSSLRRGHADLLCIVPISTNDPRRESRGSFHTGVLEVGQEVFLASPAPSRFLTWNYPCRRSGGMENSSDLNCIYIICLIQELILPLCESLHIILFRPQDFLFRNCIQYVKQFWYRPSESLRNFRPSAPACAIQQNAPLDSNGHLLLAVGSCGHVTMYVHLLHGALASFQHRTCCPEIHGHPTSSHSSAG